MPNRAASPFCAARAAISRRRRARYRRAARCPTAARRRRRPPPSLPCRRPPPPSRSASGTGLIPPPAPSETAQALRGSAKPLSAGEAAALAAALKAVDESRWADARAAVANFRNTAARPLRRLEHPAGGAQDRGVLRRDLALPARTARLAGARGAAPPGRGPHRPRDAARRKSSATSRRFPPLTSTGHMRRMEAAQDGEPQRPEEVRERQLAQRHLPQRRRERVPQPLRPSAERRGPDRPLRPPDARRHGAGRARSCGQAAARLPAARQCAPGDGDARRRRGDRAARRRRRPSSPSPRSSSSARNGCAAPAALDEAEAAARRAESPTRPMRGGTSATSVARDLLAAGPSPPTPMPSLVPHGLTKGVSFAEAGVPRRLDRAAPSQEDRPTRTSISRRCTTA